MRSINALIVILLSIILIAGCTIQKPKGSGKPGESALSKVNPNAALSMDFGTQGEILVTLADTNKMSVIDMSTFKIGDTVDVGVNPQDVTYTPDGKNYYAVMTGKWLNAGNDPMEDTMALSKDAVWYWDHAAHKIMGKASTAKSDEIPRPAGIAITPSSDRICVANMSTDELLIKNIGGSQEELARVKVGAGPRRVLVTPDSKYAIIINTDLEDRSEKDSISFVHLLSLREEAKIEVGAYPWAAVISPDGKKLYVSISGADEVDQIDIEKRKIDNQIKIGKSPRGIAILPNGNKLYVTSYNEDLVIPYDLTAGTAAQGFAVGKGPQEIAMDKNGLLLFVANNTGKSISVINLSQDKVVETIRLKGNPSAIAVWTGPPPSTTFPSEGKGSGTTILPPANVTPATPEKKTAEPKSDGSHK